MVSVAIYYLMLMYYTKWMYEDSPKSLQLILLQKDFINVRGHIAHKVWFKIFSFFLHQHITNKHFFLSTLYSEYCHIIIPILMLRKNKSFLIVDINDMSTMLTEHSNIIWRILCFHLFLLLRSLLFFIFHLIHFHFYYIFLSVHFCIRHFDLWSASVGCRDFDSQHVFGFLEFVFIQGAKVLWAP